MHKLGRLFLGIVCSSFYLLECELHNLETVKKTIIHHYENGGFQQELHQVVASVRDRFPDRASHDKQVVIFDVDEVALSMYHLFKENDFGMPGEYYFNCLRTKTFAALLPIKELYEHFKDLGYTIIFLTSRKHEFYEKTRENLIEVGYSHFDRLITRSQEESSMPSSLFKEQARLKLTQEGYEIVCCVDDLEANLQGAHVGYPVKIPNYIY